MKIREVAVQNSELIWEGRLHLGDEPGVYGDAAYTGLATDLPVTLTKWEKPTVPDDIAFSLAANEINIIIGQYPGHLITVFGYEVVPPVNPGNPAQWRKVEVGQARFTTDQITVKTRDTMGKTYFSIRVEVDTTVPPGLYDDFVLLSLNMISTTHYADFGFRYMP
ncbi:hypothetical protein [uncultured Bradyrhizobium sp.]|uniref:hypothetical protein n=1 Tax=uncultured Bradyrhizobium sp. TaxID=199684 RepID=UPI0035CC864E